MGEEEGLTEKAVQVVEEVLRIVRGPTHGETGLERKWIAGFDCSVDGEDSCNVETHAENRVHCNDVLGNRSNTIMGQVAVVRKCVLLG